MGSARMGKETTMRMTRKSESPNKALATGTELPEGRLVQSSPDQICLLCSRFFDQRGYSLQQPACSSESPSTASDLVFSKPGRLSHRHIVSIRPHDKDWCGVSVASASSGFASMLYTGMTLAAICLFAGVIYLVFWVVWLLLSTPPLMLKNLYWQSILAILLLTLGPGLVLLTLIVSRHSALKRLHRGFWRSITPPNVDMRLLKGDLVGQGSSFFYQLTLLAIFLLAAMALGCPIWLVCLLLVQPLLSLAGIVWSDNPLLNWKARFLDEWPMRAADIAVLIIMTHYLLNWFAIACGRLVNFLALSAANLTIPAMLGMYQLNPFNMASSPDVMNIFTAVRGNPRYYGFETGDLSSRSFGPAFYALLDGLRSQFVVNNVPVLLATLILALLLVVTLHHFLSTTLGIFRVLPRWERRFGEIRKAENFLYGVVTTDLKWWHRGLFSAWVIFRWLISLAIVCLCLYFTSVGLAWWLRGLTLPGLDTIVLPYSLLAASIDMVGVETARFRLVLAFLLVSPLLFVILLSIGGWVSATIGVLVRLVRWQARGADLRVWDGFLRTYDISRRTLIIHPRSGGWQVEYFLWVPVVVVPQGDWRRYCGEQTGQERLRSETLLLHEIGHTVKDSPFRWLLRILGALTFVGRGYFELAVDSIRGDRRADEYALERLNHGAGLHEADTRVSKDVLSGYIRRAGTRIAAKATFTDRPRFIWMRKHVTDPLRRWHRFFIGEDAMGYVHPESVFRRALLVTGKRPSRMEGVGEWLVSIALLLVLITSTAYFVRVFSSPRDTPAASTTAGAEFATISLYQNPGNSPEIYDLGTFEGDLYAATGEGLYVFKGGEWRRFAGSTAHSHGSQLASLPTFDLLETANGLWIGGVNQVMLLNTDGLQTFPLYPGHFAPYFNDTSVGFLLMDDSATLYLLTTDGVAVMKDQQFRWFGEELPHNLPDYVNELVREFPMWKGADGRVRVLLYGESVLHKDRGSLKEVVPLPLAAIPLHRIDNRDWWQVIAPGGQAVFIPIDPTAYGMGQDKQNEDYSTVGLSEASSIGVDNLGNPWFFYADSLPGPVLCSDRCEKLLILPGVTAGVRYVVAQDDRVVVLSAAEQGPLHLLDYDRQKLASDVPLSIPSDMTISSMALDSADAVWIATFERKLWSWDGAALKESALFDRVIEHIDQLVLSKGRVFILSDGVLHSISVNPGDGSLTQSEGLMTTRLRSIVPGPQDSIWALSEDGSTIFTNRDTANSFRSMPVASEPLDLTIDSVGDVWTIEKSGFVARYSANGDEVLFLSSQPIKGEPKSILFNSGKIWWLTTTELGYVSEDGAAAKSQAVPIDGETILAGDAAGPPLLLSPREYCILGELPVKCLDIPHPEENASLGVSFSDIFYPYDTKSDQAGYIGIPVDALVDTKGRIWVASTRGLFMIEGGQIYPSGRAFLSGVTMDQANSQLIVSTLSGNINLIRDNLANAKP